MLQTERRGALTLSVVTTTFMGPFSASGTAAASEAERVFRMARLAQQLPTSTNTPLPGRTPEGRAVGRRSLMPACACHDVWHGAYGGPTAAEDHAALVVGGTRFDVTFDLRSLLLQYTAGDGSASGNPVWLRLKWQRQRRLYELECSPGNPHAPLATLLQVKINQGHALVPLLQVRGRWMVSSRTGNILLTLRGRPRPTSMAAREHGQALDETMLVLGTLTAIDVVKTRATTLRQLRLTSDTRYAWRWPPV